MFNFATQQFRFTQTLPVHLSLTLASKVTFVNHSLLTKIAVLSSVHYLKRPYHVFFYFMN